MTLKEIMEKLEIVVIDGKKYLGTLDDYKLKDAIEFESNELNKSVFKKWIVAFNEKELKSLKLSKAVSFSSETMTQENLTDLNLVLSIFDEAIQKKNDILLNSVFIKLYNSRN